MSPEPPDNSTPEPPESGSGPNLHPDTPSFVPNSPNSPAEPIRDDKGRFVRGTCGGPGKKPGNRTIREALNHLLHRTLEEVQAVYSDETAMTADRLAAERILTNLVGTEAGRAKAFEQVADRTEGKPHQSHEIKTAEMVDPEEVYRQIRDSLGLDEDGESEGREVPVE